jgi:hypothetical protein
LHLLSDNNESFDRISHFPSESGNCEKLQRSTASKKGNIRSIFSVAMQSDELTERENSKRGFHPAMSE